jgi:hypothetical protein
MGSAWSLGSDFILLILVHNVLECVSFGTSLESLHFHVLRFVSLAWAGHSQGGWRLDSHFLSFFLRLADLRLSICRLRLESCSVSLGVQNEGKRKIRIDCQFKVCNRYMSLTASDQLRDRQGGKTLARP